MTRSRHVTFNIAPNSLGPLKLSYSYSCLSGHLSFVLLAASYGFSDIVDLRAMAIAAGIAMLAFNYYHPNGRPLWLPFKWNLLFILTNTAHLVYLFEEERRAKRMPKELNNTYEQVFESCGLSRVDFLKLVKKATIVNAAPMQNLCYEGAINRNVTLIVEGKAEVTVRGEKVYELTAGQFIGEMGIHVGLRVHDGMKSSATVTALSRMKLISWPRGTLIDFLERDESMARAIQAAISADLVQKLSRADVDAKKLHQKSEHLYSTLIESVIGEGNVTPHDRNMLRRYRIVHRISDASHNDVLKKHGWSPEEYERGEKVCAASKRPKLDRRSTKQLEQDYDEAEQLASDCTQQPF